MRISCSGCRVLRKGCSDDCTIRPCLQWIKSSESQANATLFLAKFYGRAGLINLINAGPQHLRPAIFKSLLYEACGRIVNPIFGSTGLLQSGSWHLCQAAVEAVLKGEPIAPVSSDSAVGTMSPSLTPPLKACNIRHIAKSDEAEAEAEASTAARRNWLRNVKSKKQFKRSGSSSGQLKKCSDSVRIKPDCYKLTNECGMSQGSECDSVETEEASLVKPEVRTVDGGLGVDLELRL